jgi:hypothetical protein
VSILSNVIINQHYVPQFVLKNFANQKKQVFEALVNESRLYTSNYRYSMSERFTYEHPLMEQNKLEKFFQVIESDFGPALIQAIEMAEYEKVQEVKKLFEQFYSALVIFYYRSGALLNEFAFDTTIKEAKIGYLLQKLTHTSYINELGKTLRFYDFAIVKSENGNFLISDQYVSTVALGIKGRFTNMSNRHIGLKEIMILIPLSSKYYIVYFHGKKPDYIEKDKLNILKENEVDDLNRIIINNSYLKCVGQNKEPLEKAISVFNFSSPASTYMGFSDGSIRGATLKKELFFHTSDERAWDMFVNPTFYVKYRDLRRNDPCGCNSGKKFKNCCSADFEIVKRILNALRDKHLFKKIKIHPDAQVEYSITEFFSKKTS